MNSLISQASELHTFLREMTDEWNRRLADSDDLARAHDRFVEDYRPVASDRFDAAFASMSLEVDALDANELRRVEPIVRALLQPYFLLSPFCRRVVDWPCGYPGDYRAVEMLFSGHEVATSAVGTVLGNYTLHTGPCEAHRGRSPWSHAQIASWCADERVERPAILSFACGPEVVLRRWVAAGGVADITLADHDPHALAWASRRLGKVLNGTKNPSTVREVHADAREIIKGDAARRLGIRASFDVVLVLGLLDYLEDPICVAFLESLATALRPGGLILLSNVSGPNPARALMETVGGWRVIHRTPERFAGLVGAAEHFGDLDVTVHDSGTNVYVAARRI